MNLTPSLVVLALSFGTIALGTLYFRRWQINRPPIGIFNLGDVAFTLVSILVVPLIYLAVPSWLLVGLMALGALSAIACAAEPVLPSAWARWALLGVIVAVETWAWISAGPASHAAFVVNNLVVTVVAVGLANLWAQSGMKARDAAILGGALSLYDLVATAILPTMGDLMARVGTLPFAPLVAWPAEAGARVGIGLGDLLLATVFPLVMRKAYGATAGRVAVGLTIGGIVGTFAAAGLAGFELFPVMIVLGPLTVAQYRWWASLRGAERTTWMHLQAEPRPAGRT